MKESHHREPLLEQVKPNMHEHDIEDEEEETLSFCEFSINGEADAWKESSSFRESQNSSFKSSEEDDYFEFFSGELISTGSTTISYPPENIIFCGKLISYKQPTSENTVKIENIKLSKHKKRGIFRWWNWNFASRKNASETTGGKGKGNEQGKGSSEIVSGSYKSLVPTETSKEKRPDIRRKRSKEQNLSVHKLSFFSSNSKRWYLFLFGITKFRTEMELRDMKSRQSRRQSSSFSMLKLENDGSNNEIACMNRSKGFSAAVLRALSCGGGGDHRATAIIEAPTGDSAQV